MGTADPAQDGKSIHYNIGIECVPAHRRILFEYFSRSARWLYFRGLCGGRRLRTTVRIALVVTMGRFFGEPVWGCPSQISNRRTIIGLWKTFPWLERLVLFLLGLNILRLAHSFFLLQRDERYGLAIESPNVPRWVVGAVWSQIVLQAGTVVLALFAITTLDNKFAYVYGWVMFLLVAAYDGVSKVAFQKVECHEQLKKAFNNWWKFDVGVIFFGGVAVVILLAFQIPERQSPTIESEKLIAVLEIPAALGLAVMLALDYLMYNRTFYFSLGPISKETRQ